MTIREIALFQSADQSLLIWTIENMEIPGDYRVLVNYPKRDDTGYVTVAKALTLDEILDKHDAAIKRLAIKPKIGYKKAI